LEPDFGTGRQWRPLDQALDVLWQAGAWRQELIQLLELLAERTDRRLHPLPWALPVPLRVHGRYSRAEIEAAHCYGEACGLWRAQHRIPLDPLRRRALAPSQRHRSAVHHPAHKREALFSPSTRYRDLALGPALFHWESQSTTTAASPTGQRYIHHAERGSRVLLCRCAEACGYLREQRKQDGRTGAPTEPFVCLGFARYEGHEGERILFFHQWRFAGGWSGRSRRPGCQAVAWHKSGVGDLRGAAGCSDQIFEFSIRMRTSLAERISMLW
jgi:hypothetical protein